MRQPLTDASSVPFVTRISAFGGRPAFSTSTEVVTYADLASRISAVAAELGTTRRLVLIAGANEIEPVVAYLAALSAGHPVILVPGDNPGNLAAVEAAYDPDVVFSAGALVARRDGTAHQLHPDLALLLSTSGSTGSPKLVRLSHENIEANAASIASYLSIRPDDVAATTLPMHYCYGLSVINSHLIAGASLLLTSRSVVDACFWDVFRARGATTFAGVPYTFNLLDRVGFDAMDLPSLRYLTQAGGRMSPATVSRYADLGQRRGWDLFVMYGQTEATARMAYLPPDRALASPSSIGQPIPGGSFTLEPLPEMPLSRTAPSVGHAAPTSERGAPRPEVEAPGGLAPQGPGEVGELVYSGKNVMLGYASSPADLARGREVSKLRTGDVARRTSDGLYEIIGRRSRFAKIFGLRIDLDQVESAFAESGVIAFCADAADGADGLVVAVASQASPVDVDVVRELAKDHFGLPHSAVQVCPVTEIPRLPTGKPDYRAIASLAAPAPAPAACEPGVKERLRALYAETLGRPHVTDDDSFVTLEGDSLSYVEMSIRLEDVLGHLPPNWHVTPIGSLVDTPVKSRRGFRSLESNVLLRAVAIVLIVGSHANLFMVLGAAHVLLGVAGFNFGRFHLTSAPRRERVRHMSTSIARIVVPSVVWLAFAAAVSATYTWQNVVLLNGVLGSREWSDSWHYWFIEALVYTLLAMTLLMSLPFVDRVERRWSFWLPFALAITGLLTRYEVVTVLGGDIIHRANVTFWLFALGWATVKASTSWHRALLSAVVVLTVPGFFDDPVRELVLIAGLLMLVWVPAVRVPSWLARLSGVLASASLYIYLVHWQIYPHLEDRIPILATVLSLAAGVVFWQAVTRLSPYVERLVATRRGGRNGERVAPDAATVAPGAGRVGK